MQVAPRQTNAWTWNLRRETISKHLWHLLWMTHCGLPQHILADSNVKPRVVKKGEIWLESVRGHHISYSEGSHLKGATTDAQRTRYVCLHTVASNGESHEQHEGLVALCTRYACNNTSQRGLIKRSWWVSVGAASSRWLGRMCEQAQTPRLAAITARVVHYRSEGEQFPWHQRLSNPPQTSSSHGCRGRGDDRLPRLRRMDTTIRRIDGLSRNVDVSSGFW